jgi:hypothetical protein
MITGYNTDVRHQNVVFHVQTEDKGSANPFIESLIYVGGQVLASKRASYADLLAEGKDEKSIVALMDHQHRTMIAAIRHGKFDDKLAAPAACASRTSVSGGRRARRWPSRGRPTARSRASRPAPPWPPRPLHPRLSPGSPGGGPSAASTR